MKLKKSKGLTDPNQSVDMRALHNSFMKLYRKWAGLKTKLDNTAREAAGVKIYNEFNGDIAKIKLQMTTWTSDIEKHGAGRSILGFFAKSAGLSSSTAFAGPSSSTVSAGASSSNNNNEVQLLNFRLLSSSSASVKEKPKLPPLQEACLKKIEDLKNEYNCINRKNFKTAEDTTKEKSLIKQIKEEENNLKRLKEGAKRAETYRKKLKAKRSAPPAQAQKEAIFRPGTIEERKSKVCTTTDDYLLENESEESSDEVMEEEGEEDSGGLPIINASTDPYAYINVFENLAI